jgi:hypothetical protein
MLYVLEGEVKPPVKVADGADVDEPNNAFEVGKGLNDVFEVREGENITKPTMLTLMTQKLSESGRVKTRAWQIRMMSLEPIRMKELR